MLVVRRPGLAGVFLAVLAALPHGALADSLDTAAQPDRRVFGLLPNYRTVDSSSPVEPIAARRKFFIGYKDTTDYPVFVLSGMFTGIAHATGSNPSFGRGPAGFAKRFGASYADQGVSNLMTESILPAALREDPRYFRRGTGSMKSRAAYALTRIFVTRTDSGGRRFNYSEVLGLSGTVALSTLYSPESRTAAASAQKLSMMLATDACGAIMKEFWPDIKRRFFSRHRP